MELAAMLLLVGVVGAIVLAPLVRRTAGGPAPTTVAPGEDSRRRWEDALAELEFDHATGKLADEDYAALRARLQAAAPAAPPARETVAAGTSPTRAISGMMDALEAEIRLRRRAGRFCTGCGAVLPSAARFCPHCGTRVGERR